MRLGFDAKRLWHNFTGLGNYSRTLLENLSTFYPENDYYLYSAKTIENKRTKPFANSSKFTVRKPTNASFLWRSWRVNSQLKEDEIDVYQGLSAELPYGISIPSVVTIHDLIFENYPEQYSFFDRKIYGAKAKYACHRADKIIAISEATKQDIVQFYNIEPSKIEVIYQTCDNQFFLPVSKKQVINVKEKYGLPDHFLLYVGSVIERKNLLSIVQAYQLGHFPPLVIIGDMSSDYAKKVRSEIDKNGAENDFIFLRPDFSDFPAIYKAAELFIYPSAYEGFGIPIIEAMAVGTPVITSKLSSLPEAAGPHSILLKELAPQSIANFMVKLLNNKNSQKAMSEKGLKYVQRFSPKSVTAQIIDLYKEVAKKRATKK